MSTTSRFLAPILVVAASLLFAASPGAQTTSPSSPSTTAPPHTAPGTGSSTNISDQKLNAAAAAAKKVVVLNQSYNQKIAQAPASQKQRLATEANNAMEKAVTDQGLSVEEYMSIMQVAQNDPSVREKLIQRMK